ncbi:MAG: pirin family protein [Deltaproteobacteria bacterium]|nr:pirin family protein [Deltaproteobacteria bacterium]
MITLRSPDEIFKAQGEIEEGTFQGRWHFSFGDYRDRKHTRFGALRVFNDDTLSPGAIWPLHPHREIEVVTYCAGGEFRHADENGRGGVLKKGGVQHTTVGRGMWHSEINNLPDAPMRFIQMWFYPSAEGLKPSVEQKHFERKDRFNRLLPIVSPVHKDALPIKSNARVFASFLEKGRETDYRMEPGRGAYVYMLEGGPARINERLVYEFGAAMITDETDIAIRAENDVEMLLIDVGLS